MATLSANHAGAQPTPAADPAVATAAQSDHPKRKPIMDLSLEELLEVRIDVASAKGDDIFSTPSTVSVIDADTLRRYTIESIAEALNMLPGVQVGRTLFQE